jgi:hypothetical protein
MGLSNEAIWEQVFPKDAESRVQQAFEMLLSEEFGLNNSVQLGTTVDQCFCQDYNQDNEKTVNFEGSCHPVKSIQKVSSQVFMD